jgi:two-component system NtrC family sensor kinase
MDAGLYRIEMIVWRLLSMSRDDPVMLAPTRLEDVMEDAILFAKPRLDRHGIALAREFPDEPLFLLADRDQLSQALINLILNSADAMPEGGTLTVSGNADTQSAGVVLEISDTGCGISPEHLPHVFEPFYTTKARGRGTGLGLAVVSRVIEAHGGKVTCHSQPGAGCRFRMELQPAQTGSETAQPPRRTTLAAPV